jgi:hypothetical protein
MYFICTFWGVDLEIFRILRILIVILGVKIGSVAKSRNSDTFRRSKTKSSFPIAIASKLLQYGCCNFVGVLNTTDWPICALNISKKKNYLWFLGRWPWALGDSSRFPYGARKMKHGNTQSPPLFGLWGLWERPVSELTLWLQLVRTSYIQLYSRSTGNFWGSDVFSQMLFFGRP